MRVPVAVLAATLGGAIACHGIDDPTAPSGTALRPVATVSPDAKGALVVFSGDWVPLILFGAPFEDASGESGRYRCDEGDRPIYMNTLHLERDGARIVGTTAPGSGLTCYQIAGPGSLPRWYVAIDDAFDGRVHGDEIRFSLNQHLDIRATLDPSGDVIGTLRVRVEPPTGGIDWIEAPFRMYRYRFALAVR